jgi:hypothetical protein
MRKLAKADGIPVYILLDQPAMNKQSAVGAGSLTLAGKRLVARSMYYKGKAFMAAAVMLGQRATTEHEEYVALHLLCQGIEIVLKGLLIRIDYDKYRALLKKFGHNIDKVAQEASRAFQLKPMRPDLEAELMGLSNLYGKTLLRYGGGIDILIAPNTIQRKRVFRRILAVIRLAERSVSS